MRNVKGPNLGACTKLGEILENAAKLRLGIFWNKPAPFFCFLVLAIPVDDNADRRKLKDLAAWPLIEDAVAWRRNIIARGQTDKANWQGARSFQIQLQSSKAVLI